MSMRWEDERYVRLYTKDTPSWRMLPWEGRCVLVMLLRAVDRAGVLDLGEDGPEALPVTLMLPEPVCEVGLAALLKRGTVVLNGPCLVIPNFMAAQDTPQSDKARQRAHRERARADALRPERCVTSREDSDRAPPCRDQVSHNVTESHAVTAAVTPANAASRDVTPNLTVPRQDKTNRDEPPARECAIPGGGGHGPASAIWLNDGLILLRDGSAGRFVLGTAKGIDAESTLGLPRRLWDTLRGIWTQQAPTREAIEQAARWLAAGGWGFVNTVTAQHLANNPGLYDLLTQSGAWNGEAIKRGGAGPPRPSYQAMDPEDLKNSGW